MENEKDLRTTLMEMAAAGDRKLAETYEANTEAINSFFKTLTEDGVPSGTKIEITVNDIANIYKTIEVLDKNVNSLQELAMMTSLQSKVLKQLLYNAAATNTLQPELKTN